MKILCLLGSPRKGSNSSAIARRFTDTAEQLGAEVKSYRLNDLGYRGCQACMACKTKLDKCVLQDDLTEVLAAVAESDVLVLASPVYYGDVTGQLKLFIDRTYSFFNPDFVADHYSVRLAPGEKLVFILTQGDVEASFSDIFPRYGLFMEWYGFKERHLIRACQVGEDEDITNRRDIMTMAEETARKLCSA